MHKLIWFWLVQTNVTAVCDEQRRQGMGSYEKPLQQYASCSQPLTLFSFIKLLTNYNPFHVHHN